MNPKVRAKRAHLYPLIAVTTLGLGIVACGGESNRGSPTTTFSTGLATDGSEESGGEGDEADSGVQKLDTQQDTEGGLPCNESGGCDECVVLEHTPCDDGTQDLFEAIGLNCPNEPAVTGSVGGHPDASGVTSFFGQTAEWDPREGQVMAVIGSGYVQELFMETPAADNDGCPAVCNDDLDQVVSSCSDPAKNAINQYDPGPSLPAPVMVNNVAGDCSMQPGLLGTGDCSNTIQGQFSQGMAAHDYTEMRFSVTVPEENTSFSYDFAFFSTEYPYYFGSQYNDMYVAWLESESWTGNVSFDDAGNPISLNAGFLDFRDDAGALPELAGTCMRQHAGTKWLTTTAPVTPGEDITVVLAIFDLSDSILDSYALIDNWQWGCEGTDKPSTKPQG